MSKLAVVLWIANIFFDTAGRVAFKSAATASGDDGNWQRWKAMLRSPGMWAGIACFCFEFVAWIALLSLIPLSQAILIGSFSIVAVAIAGRVLYGERLDSLRVTAITLIAIGVALAGG